MELMQCCGQRGVDAGEWFEVGCVDGRLVALGAPEAAADRRWSVLAECSGVGQAWPMPEPEVQFHRPRRSACAEAALRAEIERVRRMTIEERIKAALGMRNRFAWLQPCTKVSEGH